MLRGRLKIVIRVVFVVSFCLPLIGVDYYNGVPAASVISMSICLFTFKYNVVSNREGRCARGIGGPNERVCCELFLSYGVLISTGLNKRLCSSFGFCQGVFFISCFNRGQFAIMGCVGNV